MAFESSVLSRGWLLASLVSVVALGLGTAAAYAAEPAKFWVFVGTYTEGKSKGIYRMALDAATGKLVGAVACRRTGKPVVPGGAPDAQVPLRGE